MTGAPQLTVIVVSDGAAPSNRAMPALTSQGDGTVEVIAATPETRHAALATARGQRVALLGDRYLPGPDWIAASRAALKRWHTAGVIWGPIEHGGRDRVFDWAVQYCEYASYMRPLPAGPSPQRPPASNVWLDQAVARQLGAIDRGHGSEIGWHNRLRRSGIVVCCEPALTVRHAYVFGRREYLRERYDYARLFTRERLRGTGVVRRALHALLCLLLPPVLMIRICRQAFRLPGHRARVIRAMPYLVLFAVIGVAGEIRGCADRANEAGARA